LGDYKQHVSFAGVLGVLYAWGAFALAGIPWLYGTIAAMLATLSGLLPDLDHPVGVELKGFTGILGVLGALAVWEHVGRAERDLPFELHLWAVVLTFVLIRYGLRRFLAHLMVHRGISHSIPTCAVWGSLAYLYYPSQSPLVRATMAAAVILGFLSHLLLDEICSVDLTGARIKRSFGTAIKFWAPSPTATIGVYAILFYLSWRILDHWPQQSILAEKVTPPTIPWSEWLESLKALKSSSFGQHVSR
jgi:LexA-binding, inner membrane-associated putative hydrolase